MINLDKINCLKKVLYYCETANYSINLNFSQFLYCEFIIIMSKFKELKFFLLPRNEMAGVKYVFSSEDNW